MSLLRKTTQNPLPVCKPETGKNQYDIYPTHDLGPDKIFCDYTSLARRLAGQKQVVVDGYVGVRFDLFRQELNRALTQLGIRPVWWSVDAALRPQGPAVESSVTDLQVALCELYEEKEEN